MTWDEFDELHDSVIDFADWFPILNYKAELEARAGVYIFADDELDVKYIGKAGAGRMIKEGDSLEKSFEVYSAIYRNKDFAATQVMALYTNSDRLALHLEQELIDKYNPPNNGIDLLKD